MRKGRRTKRRFTWFPMLGTQQAQDAGDGQNFVSARLWNTDTVPVGQSIRIFPLTFDVPLEGEELQPNAGGQLAQALGQEYLIERIVGKCFVGTLGRQDDAPTVIFPKILLVTCGIFVARCNDEGAAGGVNTPIGSASFGELAENYSPGNVQAIREPWMWRRSWILGTGTSVNADFNAFAGGQGTVLNGTNLNYGSIQDGPHVDVKVNRKVGNDDRLWFAVSCFTLDAASSIEDPSVPWDQVLPSPTNVGGGCVLGVLDLRILGQVRRARAHGAF